MSEASEEEGGKGARGRAGRVRTGMQRSHGEQGGRRERKRRRRRQEEVEWRRRRFGGGTSEGTDGRGGRSRLAVRREEVRLRW